VPTTFMPTSISSLPPTPEYDETVEPTAFPSEIFTTASPSTTSSHSPSLYSTVVPTMESTPFLTTMTPTVSPTEFDKPVTIAVENFQSISTNISYFCNESITFLQISDWGGTTVIR
jgi:hypothetical protein